MYKKRVLATFLAASMLCGCGSQISSADSPTVETDPTVAVQAEALAFPYEIPDAPLVAEELICYQGPYWEDGSGEQLENVAGLMVYNPTEQMVQSAAFAVDTPGETLYFYVSWLPPGSRCLVLEMNRQEYTSESVSRCRLVSVRWTYSQLSGRQVDYVGLGSMVTITNREDRIHSRVVVWYKRYASEGEYYLGGAAFSACLLHLQPGEQRMLKPEIYDSANARIVRIEVK